MTIDAVEAADSHLKGAPFNPYRLTVEQGVSELMPG